MQLRPCLLLILDSRPWLDPAKSELYKKIRTKWFLSVYVKVIWVINAVQSLEWNINTNRHSASPLWFIYLLSNTFLSVVLSKHSRLTLQLFILFPQISCDRILQTLGRNLWAVTITRKQLVLFCFTTGGAPYFLCMQEHLAVWINTSKLIRCEYVQMFQRSHAFWIQLGQRKILRKIIFTIHTIFFFSINYSYRTFTINNIVSYFSNAFSHTFAHMLIYFLYLSLYIYNIKSYIKFINCTFFIKLNLYTILKVFTLSLRWRSLMSKESIMTLTGGQH